MEPAMLRSGRTCRKLAPSVVALALAAIIGGAATTSARAEDYDQGGRGRHWEQRDHGNRHYDRQRDRDTYYYSRPSYVYAPPPVYYAPPPGPPVIDFVFPLRFR